MASRKEEKERLRREREEREQAAAQAARRKRLVGYGIGAALAVAVIVVIAVFVLGSESGEGGSEQQSSLYPPNGVVAKPGETDVKKAAKAAGCDVKQARSKSRDHVGNPNEQLKYDSNPPTSGKHYEIPGEDQAYTEPPADSSVVHSLEHGRVDIWFKPNAPRQTRADLKATFDSEQGYQLLLIPRPEMPYQMAATAWGREPEPLGTGYLLGCPKVDAKAMTALRAFIDEHRGNGPEPVP